jgi:hypothetical protein
MLKAGVRGLSILLCYGVSACQHTICGTHKIAGMCKWLEHLRTAAAPNEGREVRREDLQWPAEYADIGSGFACRS